MENYHGYGRPERLAQAQVALTETDSRPTLTEPWRQLRADMVLWLALVLLFLAFRVALFWIFRGELSQRPSGQAFLRCFETGLRSDTPAATWALLRSFALTLMDSFIRWEFGTSGSGS